MVYKCRVNYLSRGTGGAEVEWDGPEVVLKGILSLSPPTVEQRTTPVDVLATMLGQQAAEFEVLCGLPPHPNIVEVVHFFEAPAMLLRPFVADVRLPYTSVSKTT